MRQYHKGCRVNLNGNCRLQNNMWLLFLIFFTKNVIYFKCVK